MATKGDPKNKGQAARDSYRKPFEQAKFVQYTLSESEKEACKKWLFDPEVFETMLGDLMEAGYRVTFRYDTFSHSPACWLLPSSEDKDNANMILAGRGSTYLKAFKQACFLHWNVFDQQWPRMTGNETEATFDD